MQKILNISFTVCLLGVMSSLIYSIDPGNSIHSNIVFVNTGDSLDAGEDASIHSASNYLLFIAEINHDVPSEIDPQKSFSADWSINQNKPPLRLQYLIRAQRFLVSQSVRNLIFPFHSFL